jgi:hypothetical protein
MNDYPVTFSVDYPDRPLDRLSSAFRIFTVIPIAIVIGVLTHGAGILFFPVLLLLLFRNKYPRWWFDWNLELQRFWNRVSAYAMLMDDRYPATDEQQSVHLELPYPGVEANVSQGLPLIKWLLVIPHVIVLAFLYLGVLFAVIAAWFAILFTGRYPRGIFDYVEGVMRWHNRVVAYAFLLVTDRYPPFSLRP